MDWQTVLLATTSSLGVSLAGAWWLSQTLVQHRLSRAMEAYKAELKQDADLALGERAAQRQYEYDARKRLYTAIGPLRFQLLLACREWAGRVQAHGSREQTYRMSLAGYYGRSTLYRLLRPLALAELIEREIAYFDFTVDAAAMDCLRFKKAATRMLSGDEVLGDHPGIDWSRQAQHAYTDSLAACAAALIVADSRGERVMRFHEFQALMDDPARVQTLDPFPALLGDFELRSKPLLWARLVGYGHACQRFVDGAGQPLGFETQAFPTERLLQASGDATLLERCSSYVQRIETTVQRRL
ncbi:MAG: hypothetical protein WAQ05_19205 [Rubrivivax sp.]